MNAQPPFFAPPAAPAPGLLPGSGRSEFGQASANALSMKWAALHDAAGIVAMLAGAATEPMKPEVRNFPATMRNAGGWRWTMAEQGTADLAAIMEPGLAALLAVQARGVSPAAAAHALWQEFQTARNALLALIPPVEEATPLRRFT